MSKGWARMGLSNGKNMARQAAHFDEKAPLTPWPLVLRTEGFRYHYIAKDLLIKKAFDEIKIDKGSRVLDVGCGVGVWLDRLGSSYGTIGTGVDISPRSLGKAQSCSVRQSVFVLADARELPFASESFDLVVSLDVLEHIQQPERAVDELIRVACRGGHIVLYAVSKRNTFTYQWFERKLLARIGIDLNPRACHAPTLFIDPDLIRERLGAGEVQLKKLEFFHAFFTSLFDRTLLITYFLCKNLGLFDVPKSSQRKLATIFLSVASLMSRLALAPLLWLDRAWLQRGYANGFLAVACRIAAQGQASSPSEQNGLGEMLAGGTRPTIKRPKDIKHRQLS